MADFDIDLDDDFEDDDVDTGYVDQSSALVKKLRKQLRQAANQLKERDSELSSLRSEGRSRAIRDVLASRGVNPKIAAFVPADIDPSEDAVASWLDQYGDVFGVQSVQTESAQPSANIDASALSRMSVVEEQGLSVDAMNDIASQIANVGSREELQALLRNA